jgi:hypothetical protein
MSDKLKKQLALLEKTFEGYKDEFARDGKVTQAEAVILKSVSAKLATLRKKVVEYEEKQGIVSFEDEPMVVKSEVKRYDDVAFTVAFDQSIKDWSQDGNIALNRVKTYFISTDKPKGLSLNDVLSVAGLVMKANPKAAAIIGTINTIAALVTKAYEASLPSTPTLNEIHASWADAIHTYGADDHADELEEFVAEWKKKNGIPADVDEVPVAEFLPACKAFAKTYFPSPAQVEKAFLAKILSKVEDSFDWDDGDGLDKAGVADVRLVELVGNFSQPKGQLDDVGGQLLEAVKTVWSKERVVDLPVQIRFSIQNVNSAEKAVIVRSSRTAGDTSFKLESGDQEVYAAFMKKRAYEIPKVSDLRVDS